MKIVNRLVAVIAVASCLGGCTFNVKEEIQEITLTHSSAGLTKVIMKSTLLDDNAISVRGTDEKSVTITAIARLLVLDDSRVDLAGLQLTISPEGIVGYICPEEYQDRITLDNLTMHGNKSLDCELESISGNITVSGMEGFITGESVSGNCVVESKHGCSIENVSGDITVTLVFDSLIDSTQWNMKSTSGEIEVFIPSDTLAFLNKVCTITIKSTSGDVAITVPKGFAANLSYTTSSGDHRITSDFIDADTSTIMITCKTTSGDLRIKSYKQ